MSNKRRGLGRGLDSFISESSFVQEMIEDRDNSYTFLKIDQIEANPNQPRTQFDKKSLEDLSESITEVGVLQPILVQKVADKYEVVAGERRLRAAQMAGLEEIPSVIVNLSEEDLSRIAIIENVQREDLNPMEESQAYHELQQRFGYTQEQLSEQIGKSRPYIANLLRLQKLPNQIQALIRDGKINISQAKILLSIKDEKEQLKRALEISELGSTVRETQRKVSRRNVKTDPYMESLENQLMDRLGTKVQIKNTGRKRKLTIDYYSDEDLDRILTIIMGGIGFES